ncbi:hypothetical protein CesoFtcFv8_020952 [Champsocephalus esox]|uniref:Uncharacterized protein n=2 Tax=Champsocephalus TaxID=52236 RepID=A0AAN8HDE8_CHAGU|nr:hypothetical protein CesoFtcFv8_020952 [Champsocephalus esox]KAK5908409.1 hypothetical protein CgunFtcFv8_016472 [Champsocephalus gunnari]
MCCEYQGKGQQLRTSVTPVLYDSVSQDALPAECIELAALMNSVVLGVRGQRLGVLQLASRAAVDSSEEAFSGQSRRGEGEAEGERRPKLFLFMSCLMYSTPQGLPLPF